MPTVSFDLDGVLIRNPFGGGVIPRVRAHVRAAPALAGLAPDEANARIDRAIREAWGARMARGDFVGAYDWDAVYGEVSRAFGGDGVPDVAGLVRTCCGEEGMIALLPGARETLERLRALGFGVVAATNGYHPYQWPVLEALGVAGLFDDVLSPDRVGHAKPAPEYFAAVPDLVAHVGDTLEHDVLGANLAGATSVWFIPSLPDAVRAAPPERRTRHPAFAAFHAAALAASPYRHYHPAPSDGAYLPDLVTGDVLEVPAMAGAGLLGRRGAAGA